VLEVVWFITTVLGIEAVVDIATWDRTALNRVGTKVAVIARDESANFVRVAAVEMVSVIGILTRARSLCCVSVEIVAVVEIDAPTNLATVASIEIVAVVPTLALAKAFKAIWAETVSVMARATSA
jgi:hypothetical protein